MEKPYTSNAKVTETMREFVIEIPARKNYLTIVSLVIWLCAWLTFEVLTIKAVWDSDAGIDGRNTLILFWLILWSIGGILQLRALVWILSGKEEISFSKTSLTLFNKGLLFSKAKVYDLREVRGFGPNRQVGQSRIPGGLNMRGMINGGKQGTLRFQYGMKRIDFAHNITLAEAKHLTSLLKSKGYLKD